MTLPSQLTPLVGRERELTLLTSLLHRDDVRLVTVTGAGGVGKTRLAIEAANQMETHFADRSIFVSLAPVTDPELVPATIASTLGIRDTGARPIRDSLIQALRPAPILLILDNFEHLIGGAPVVTELLQNCPRLTVMVTSRTVLRITGEHEFPVPPLELPPPSGPGADHPPFETLAANPAVTLFVQRATAANVRFALTDQNAPDVAEICARLDGLPLAIELAAARIKVLAPQAMLNRLDHRLPFLIGGARDLPGRLQTMESAIAWSYDLLLPAEQTLLRHLSVFAGGFTLDAAEAVVGARGWGLGARERTDDSSLAPSPQPLAPTVFDGLASLVHKSLLRQQEMEDGELRLFMLETIREFANNQLADRGEETEMRMRHAAWCLEFAGRGPRTITFNQRAEDWLQAVDPEYDNMRAALDWLEREGDPAIGLRLVVGLRPYWFNRGQFAEGTDWLDRFLVRGPPASTNDRAHALIGAAILQHARQPSRALARVREALAIRRELGNEVGVAEALIITLRVEVEMEDYAAADEHGREVRQILRRLDHPLQPMASILLGISAYRQGHLPDAEAHLAAGLTLGRETSNTWVVGVALNYLGLIAADRGDQRRAARFLIEAAPSWRQIGMAHGVGDCLARAATLLLAAGNGACVAWLLGAAEGLRQSHDDQFPFAEHRRYARTIAEARRLLTDERYDADFAAGTAVTGEEALTEALRLLAALAAGSDPVSPPMPETAGGAVLTPRERDVLRLIATGKSNREIADILFISHRTTTTHVTHILGKLGVDSRTAAATYAIHHDLA